ncbi:MAG TPA: hypothetical protein P5121_15005 [Caldilineaceae bacterium]|nr:hypothetical protein [Caldilineaceae bacterium]
MDYDFTKAVLSRPKMYTMNGSFGEVVAFLQGYYSGLAKSPEGLDYTTKYWSSFEYWLAHQIGGTEKTTAFRVLLNHYQDDALEELRRYYLKFRDTDSS